MPNINELKNAISNLIAEEEKAYNLPHVCLEYGLDSGDDAEANAGKYRYVLKRLSNKSEEFVLLLAEKLIIDYESTSFAKIASKFIGNMFKISIITRRNIIDELIYKGNVEGKINIIEFCNGILELKKLPSKEYGLFNAEECIQQHMLNNNDWDYKYLFEYIGLIYLSDKQFIYFLEQVVNPFVREKKEQKEYVDLLNKYLNIDGFELKILNYISGSPIYKVVKLTKGVNGSVKNLIFSADGPKPEIIFSDSLNNDIQIIRNEEYCLVYDKIIPETGLLWTDLVSWWGKESTTHDNSIANELYKRLFKSLDSQPEKLFFYTYYSEFPKVYNEKLPTLIPQVYLHYDPYTVKIRGAKSITRQRMDFLFLFSNRVRVVIEIDGKQHYSVGDISSPELYSTMVSADRELRLRGYEVYRFGGYELSQKNGKKVIVEFINELFKLYSIKV